jgi:RNA polymerase sigma-70 factor (ECF subfamily)
MDHELVAQAQQGDQQAFESLTLAHHTRLFRVAHGILRDRHLAEDATQQAFLDIWRYIRRLRDPAKFNGWSYRLLVHACYAESRRSKTGPGSVEALTQDIAAPVDEYRPVADRDQLERAFGLLSLDHRAVIVLRHLLGMTPDEIADALDISREAVYSRLRRAVPALRAALEADTRTPIQTSTRQEVAR